MLCFGFSVALELQVKMLAQIKNLVQNLEMLIDRRPLRLEAEMECLRDLLSDTFILRLIYRYATPDKIFILFFMHISFVIQIKK